MSEEDPWASSDGQDPWDRFHDPFEPEEPDETTWAQGRQPQYDYLSKGFPHNRPNSSDLGQPARFAYKVFDPEGETWIDATGEEWHLHSTEKGRYQFKLLLVREAGRIKELWIQRVPEPGRGGNVRTLLNLKEPDIQRLVDCSKCWKKLRWRARQVCGSTSR